MPIPLKTSIQQDFRNELGSSFAPPKYEENSPILPVAVVAGNVGLPKPRSNQTLKTYFWQHNATTGANISTVSSTKKVYFVGAFINVTSGVGGSCNFFIFDDTSDTARADGDTNLLDFRTAPTASLALTFNDCPPLPVELKRALRVYTSVAVAGGTEGVIYYIEETIEA